MLHGDIIDEFHNQYGFADAGAAEQADFAAPEKWLQQVNDFDSGYKHLKFSRLILKGRCMAMDRIYFLRCNRTEFIYWLANHVQHSAQGCWANRNGDWASFVDNFHPADQALGGLHRYTATAAFAQVLLDFDDNIDWFRNLISVAHDVKCLIDRWK